MAQDYSASVPFDHIRAGMAVGATPITSHSTRMTMMWHENLFCDVIAHIFRLLIQQTKKCPFVAPRVRRRGAQGQVNVWW
jgi:hypothetical protein